MDNSSKTCLFLNGSPPGKALIDRYCPAGSAVLCTDGAYDYLLALDLTPDLLIGDMDSISELPEAARVQILASDGMENNDLEKALIHCRDKGMRTLRIFGADGKRLDHFLVNFATLAAYAGDLEIEVFTKEDYLRFFTAGTYVLPCEPGQRFSLLAAKEVSGLTLSGARFALEHDRLAPGSRGLGNRATARELHLSFSSGLLIYISDLLP